MVIFLIRVNSSLEGALISYAKISLGKFRYNWMNEEDKESFKRNFPMITDIIQGNN
jgi:hypothetical protein